MQDAKRRAIIFTVISVVLAGMAGILFLQKVNAVDAGLGDKVTIYVAAKPITARQPLKQGDFKPVKVPKRYLFQSAVTNLYHVQIEGRYELPIEQLVTVVPLKPEEPLTANILKPAQELSGDNRMVALVQSDRVYFDEPLSVNDRVDIVVSLQKNGNEEPKTITDMRDKKVVAVSSDGKAIWLELSLPEAERLIHHENFAQSIRVLKAPQYSENQKSSSVTRENPKDNVIERNRKESDKKPTTNLRKTG